MTAALTNMSQTLLMPETVERYCHEDDFGGDMGLSPGDIDAMETPTKRNKRKLSEPKKRTTDFSIKRFCPDSPVGSVADSETSDDRERPRDRSSPAPFDLSLTPNSSRIIGSHTTIRTPLKVPTLPRQTACKPDSYFVEVADRVYNRVTSPEFSQSGDVTDANRLAAHILNTKSNDYAASPPMQRFGHYPSEMSKNADDPYDLSNLSKKQRKNYKNMTRARRVEANARERSRVHTISAAFEALRRAVPSYSYNQKLSKLAILRIASTYILSLARLADMDAGQNSAPNTLSFSECVDLCTRTIQTEGRARRRH